MVTERSAGLRQVIGAVAGLGALLMIGASFLPWISTGTEDGGTTTITGWGGITGSSGIAGTNLNDVLDGDGTYRPGLIGAIFGVVALVAAIAIASVKGGARPHRVTAAVLSLCGLVGYWLGAVPGPRARATPGCSTPARRPPESAPGSPRWAAWWSLRQR